MDNCYLLKLTSATGATEVSAGYVDTLNAVVAGFVHLRALVNILCTAWRSGRVVFPAVITKTRVAITL